METTNERHIITNECKNEAEHYSNLMHLGSYNFATKYIENKTVLNYGCGSGYGTYTLSKKAKFVIGIDISCDTIRYARHNYSSNNIDFKTMSSFNNKKFKEKFDTITSFQVIEHVFNADEYLKNIYNLLKPGGIFLLTTPNKKNRLFPIIQKPWNIYHIKEYSEFSLKKILQKYYKKVDILNISAETSFVKHEIKRVKKQKIITLPFTLIFYPRFLIIFLLKKQTMLYNWFLFSKNNFIPKKSNTNLEYKFISNYNLDAIIIEDNLPNTTDLLGICKKE